jgi:organic radical activating enzyme
MPRGKKHSSTIENSCNAPYRNIVIDYNSNCLICRCDGWLPIPVGQVQDFDTVEEVLSSPVAKILQKDIDDKKFTWCAVNHCGIINGNVIDNIYHLQINIDESCNLWCPSCRRQQIMHINGPEFEKKHQDFKKILQWLDRFQEKILITLSGNGDPLASLIVRPMFHDFRPKSTHKLLLKTNGLLIKKQLSKSDIFHNIVNFSISVDAGTEDVYHKIRRGGKWSSLIENLDFLAENNKSKITTLNYAIQNSNFRDIENFVALCERYDFSGVVHELDDWSTWNSSVVVDPDSWTINNGIFPDHNVLDKEHKNFLVCKEYVNKVVDKKNIRITPRVLQLLDIRK